MNRGRALQTKHCRKCNQDKQLGCFSLARNRKDGLQPYCSACNKADYAAYKLNNQEKIRDQARANYAKRRDRNPEIVIRNRHDQYIKHKERSLKNSNDWRERNPDQFREVQRKWAKANPEKRAEIDKRSRKSHPERFAERDALNKARKIRAAPTWLTSEHRKQIEQTYKTAQRVTIETGIQHHVDHIVPLAGKSVRGLHVPWNLRVITAHENLVKSNNMESLCY